MNNNINVKKHPNNALLGKFYSNENAKVNNYNWSTIFPNISCQ